MKKISIFGATGKTGVCALESAINKGYKVKALVRSLDRVPDELKSKADYVVGDVLSPSDVSQTIEGTEAVCVVLGTRDDLKPTTMLSEGLKNIINAMKEHKVTKVSVCLSAFLFYEVDKVPKMFVDLNADHQRMLDTLKSSDLQYIAVLPPHIADEPRAPYKVEYNKSPGRSISKYDLADFLLDSLYQEEHYNKICGLATIK
ncbi:flavin reductase (NADPH)-like [Ctenocephalides felis]|uniref:flavin reductase (NADPH)-like n=1 Tax=Ctenocephalides felis TaxID=7515 RepID=UPI000E6E5380|nr:flavin reductase (NADPH)-like [Ctenocephalides felis]